MSHTVTWPVTALACALMSVVNDARLIATRAAAGGSSE